MTPPEAAAFLAAVAAFDGRNLTEANAHAWSSSLHDVPLADALEYLPLFFRTATRDTKNWLMPGDVVVGVTDIQRERVRRIHLDAYRSVTGLDLLDVINGVVEQPANHLEAWSEAAEVRAAALSSNSLAMSKQEALDAAQARELQERRDPDQWSR